MFIDFRGGRLSGTTAPLVCTHCEVTFRLRTLQTDVHYRCIRCRRPVGPAARADAGTAWLYSGDILRRTNTFDPGQTWGDAPTRDPGPNIERLGRFEVVDEVGRGGMGVVYLAYDPSRQQHVALKVLLAGALAHQTQSQRFLREAQAAARLSHPAIVSVHEIGDIDGRLFFAMDYIEGVTLRAVLDSGGTLPAQEACRIAAVVARGLAAAHESGFAHRDVKPANILIEPDGRPYITDFGLVIETDASRLTQTGTVMGTPAYMAPELAAGQSDPDFARVDVYALGAVLYEMLSGQRPYDGQAGMQVLLDILAEPPPPLSSLVPVDPDIEIIVQRAMARDPAYRYPDATTLAEDLERHITGRPIEAQPLSRTYHAIQFARTYRRQLMAVVATITLTVLGTSGIWLLQEVAESRTEARREALAAERLSAMTARVDALVASGEQEQAEQAFLAFTTAEAHAGTRAIGRAWLGQAERERVSGSLDAELGALGTAFTSTSDRGVQNQTLLEIARSFQRQCWWHRIDAAVDLVETEDPALRAEVHDLRVEAAIALRDLDRALALIRTAPDGPDSAAEHSVVEPVLSRLQGTALGREANDADAMDIDQDGQTELVLYPTKAADPLIAYAADLTEVRRTRVTTYPNPFTQLDGAAGLFVGAQQGRVTAYRWTDEALESLGSWSDTGALASTAAVDVDGDGTRNHYLGFGPYSRHLAELVLGESTLRAPHRDTDRAQSDISGLAGMDLTGDGRQELIVAAGPWNAWDLRVLAFDGRGLEMIGRKKIGFVTGLSELDLGDERVLVATKSDIYPSIRSFPAETPYGPPAGVYLLGWEDDQLVERGFLPAPRSASEGPMRLANPVAVDLDGDGRQDLAMTAASRSQNHLVIWRQLADGQFARMVIGGLRVLTVFDDRLVVVATQENRKGPGPVWLLGGGTDFPEPLSAYRHSPTPPSEMPATELGIWRRAESLLTMGLLRQSAATLEELGHLVAGTELAGRAWMRAGAIREEADDVEAALRDYEEAVATPSLAGRAQLASAQLLYAKNRFEASRSMAERIRTHPDPDISEPVEALWPAGRAEDTTVVTTLSFGQPLAPQWQINPLAVRRDANAGELVVDAVTGHGPVATLPLTRVGPLSLDVDLVLNRLEWASGLEVSLRPRERPDQSFGLAIGGWGGGGLLDREVGCRLPGVKRIRGSRTPATGSTERVPLHGELRASYTQDALSCRITDPTGKTLHTSRSEATLDTASEDWELVITSSGDEAADAIMLAQIALSRVTIEGAVIAETAQVDAAPAEDPSKLDPEALVRGLRSRRAEMVPRARARFGHDYFTRYASAWLTAAEMHPEDAAVHQALLEDLSGLRTFEPRSPAEREVRDQLLMLRGRARWRAGQADAARDDLEAILDADVPGREGSPSEVRFQAHRLLAAIAITRGDEAAAKAQATEALAAARSPELGLDRLLADPHLGQMRDAAGWEPIFGD